jgi:hypothetical protein
MLYSLLPRSRIAIFDALVTCKLVGREPLYISTGRGRGPPGRGWIFRDIYTPSTKVSFLDF